MLRRVANGESDDDLRVKTLDILPFKISSRIKSQPVFADRERFVRRKNISQPPVVIGLPFADNLPFVFRDLLFQQNGNFTRRRAV